MDYFSRPAALPRLTAAQRELVAEARGLVAHTASHLSRRYGRILGYAELHAAGMMGLVEAALGFDTRNGTQFAAYAICRIRGAMLDEVRFESRHRRPGRLAATMREPQPEGRHPMAGEAPPCDLAAAFGAWLAASRDELLRDEEASRTQAALTRQRLQTLAAAVATLPPAERTVIDGHYGRGEQLKELARRLRWPYIRARRVRDSAIRRLRRRIGGHIGGMGPSESARAA